MNISKNTLPKSQIELAIELTAQEMAPFVEKAVEKISENLKVPGFRPGKVPYDVLKQQVGEMEIYQEAAAMAVQKCLSDVVKQEKIFFVGQPQVNIEKLAPGNSFLFKAVLTLLPEVTLPAWDAITKVSRKPVEIAEDDIQKGLKELQRMRQKESLKSEAAQPGDKVEIDFDIFRDSLLIENGQYKKYSLVLGDKVFIPGFEEHLLGMRGSEQKEFELTFPENYFEKNLAGKKATFKVTMQSIYQVDIPELTDEFAQSLGRFKTLDELRAQIRENIELEAKRREEQRFEQEVLQAVLAHTTFGDVADMLVESEMEQMLSEMKTEMTQYGMKWEDYLSHLKKTEVEVKEGLRNQAIERIKFSLLVREVGAKENIAVSEQEVNQEQDGIISAYQDQPEVVERLRSDRYREQMTHMLENRKIIEFIKDKIGEKGGEEAAPSK